MENIINKIKNAGIVGAGGAGFPTHVKVDTKCDYLIVNAAECEPLIRVDQQLMIYKIDEILEALQLIMDITTASKGIIGIKKKHKKAIEIIRGKIINYHNMEIYELEDFYPAGDEQTLTYEVLNRLVPEGGIPLNVGAVVLNSETLLNIYNSVVKNTPVVDKYITITGEVKNPMTVKVPIGVAIKELLSIAGGTLIDDFVVIDGGPMMGKIVDDLNGPVTKTTKALIVLPKNHHVVRTKTKPVRTTIKQSKVCMNCNMCSEVCPRNLLGHKLYPHKLMRVISYKDTLDNKSPLTTAFLCCECRLCEYVCNMELQPWRVNQLLKGELNKSKIKNPHHNSNLKVHEFKDLKKFPVKKLIMRLGINKYNVEAPLVENIMEFDQVKILLKQHIGAIGNILVKSGDKVTRGQLLIEVPENKLGANIHTSIDGVIDSIDESGIIIKTMKEVI